MARVKDLWHTTAKTTPSDGETVTRKEKTARHPDNGGNKNAKRWLAIWIDPDGYEKSRAFAKFTEADKYGKEMEADAARGEYIDPRAGKEKFGPIAEKYLRLRDIGGPSRQRYEGVYRNQVEGIFAHRAVRAVKPTEVLEWLRSPAIARLSSSTKGLAFMIVAGAFDLAVADGLRRDNPARSKIVPTPGKDDPAQGDAWNADQVWRVHDAHPERYRAIPACAAGLGLRQCEALALGEEDFDFTTGKVHIRRQLAKVNRTWVFKLPKDGKERVVPLARGVASVVQAHIKSFPPKPYELPWLDEHGKVASEPRACRLLFRWVSDDPRTSDMHIKSHRYNDGLWKPALAAAGIIAPPVETARSGPYFEGGSDGNGTHALRHFYSTTLQDAGVSPVGVMEFMGHSRKGLPITFRVYGHVTEKTFEAARQAVDGTLFRLRPIRSAGTVTELRAAQ